MFIFLCFLELIDDGESSDKDVKEPSKEEMHAAVVDILKEVDFNKVSEALITVYWF